MKIVRTLDELDEALTACDSAASDDALRAVFTGFSMEMTTDTPKDPFSPAYYDYQMELYRRISGRTYSLTNESTPFDVDQAVRQPFPYSTQSCQTAGEHLVMIGHFLRHLRLPPQSRIVEFGPGWGNLTLALASLGHRVTAVDVEPRFCQLIRRRAEQLGLAIDVVNADFNWANSVEEPFDAIIFFECFHHAADHRSALRGLHKALKPGGAIYMGAEPIHGAFPIPWGLRMDGMSLWSIRKFGWMELGFRDDYFQQVLSATGWTGMRHALSDPAIWEIRATIFPLRVEAADARLGTVTGQRVGGDIVLVNAEGGPALFGPYLTLPEGDYRARIHVRFDGSIAGAGEMQICAQGTNLLLSQQRVDTVTLSAERPFFELPFSLTQIYPDLEVRLINDAGFSGHVIAVEIIQAS